MEIIRATEKHVLEIGRLFDLYRQFYECEADLALATAFIRERLAHEESVIFVAEDGDKLLGFTQLYPSFCSVELMKVFILYDLYVDETGRNKGVGAKLMTAAHEFAKTQGAARVDLLTAHSNYAGQHLYEKLGYIKVNQDFYAYSLYL